MAIKEITKSEVHFIETDEEDYYRYTRYSATNWTVVMGESDEPVYDCEELESEFQCALAKSLTEAKAALPIDIVMPQSEQLKAFIRWNNQHNGIASPVPEGMADHYIKSL